ncbi:Urb2/Npa2 family-domain-containing protein [Macrophomina phaseolina]|uniref:Urb2/Npa2 family-domain-containing protein n=1 Tax=Macrophomina phaseolina TaxID=35725 RepID=A0ABQ8G2L4_9PEZI|nr:Urb2/Npa2 family-domain-containing protein [Macrophomina phaseolina]
MAPIAQPMEVPSLRRLLALDKDFSTFDEKLDHATSIIGQPDGARHRDDAEDPLLFYKGSPRTEWVLRWLLGKFKADDPEGLSARGNWLAWQLLRRVLLGLPPAISAKLLNANGFLAILEKTLQENFVAPHRDHRPQEEATVKRRKDSKASRKRKRDGTPVEEPDVLDHESEERLVLFEAVAGATVEIAAACFDDSASYEKSVAELLKSVLRTNTAQAAHLLRLWLESLHYLILKAAFDGRIPVDSLLPHVLQIWNASVADLGSDSSSAAERFSQECLVPTVVLLSDIALQVDFSVEPSAVEAGRGIESRISRTLETLLARHVFIPARASFFAESEGRQMSKPGQARPESLDISRLLEPLRLSLAAVAEDAGPRPLESDRHKLFETVGSLLDIAIRCSQRSTPKKRLDEAPWLQYVFVSLCHCIGAPVSSNLPGSISEDQRSILDQMLDILSKRKVALDSEILENLIRSYSGVVASEGEAQYLDQRLIARIIHYDATVFLDSPRRSGDDGIPLADALFHAVSAASVGGFGSSCSHVSDGSSHKSTATSSTKTSDFLKASIVIPLMKAYAQARDLTGFISRWSLQLQQLSKSAAPMETSVWVEKEVIAALRDVLEATLTAKQIFDLLSEQWHHISACEKTAGNNELSEASASLVIVDALVGALHSDETIASVVSVLQSLQKSLLILTGISKEPVTVARALRTISRIHILLRPHQKPQDSKEFTENIFSQAREHSVIEAIRAAEKSDGMGVGARGEEAFNLIATLCSDFMGALDLKEPAKDLFNQSAVALFRSNEEIRDRIADGAKRRRTTDPMDVAKARLEVFTLNAAAVLTQFPSLLTLPPLESLKSLLRLLFWHAFGEFSGQYEAPRGLSYTLVFEAMSDLVLTMQSGELRDLLFSVLYEALDSEAKLGKSRELGDQLRAFAEIQYLRVPVVAIGRKHREQILDRVTEMCTVSGKRKPNSEAFFRHLSLAAKLMEVPNATSELATEADLLWTIARTMQDHNLAELDSLKILDELVRLTLEHAITVKDQTKGQQFLDGFRKMMRRFARDAGTFKDHIAELTCFKSGLVALKMKDQLWDDEETYKTMKRYLRTLDGDLETLLPGALSSISEDDTAFLRAVLSAASDLPIRTMTRDGYICSIEAKLLKVIRKRLNTNEADTFEQPEASMWVSLTTAVSNVASSDEAECVSAMIYDLWRCDLSASDRHSLLEATRKALGSLGLDRRTSLLRQLKFSPNDEQNWQPTLVLMNILISSLPDVPGKEETSTQGLNGFLGQLSNYLDNHWLVSQWAIERIIDSLARLASSSGPELPSEQADAIYTRLCGTTHLILSLHRTRLGGRFHVLMPLLQNLLRCLFISDPSRHNGATTPPLPPWLAPAAPNTPLTPTHASAFARLVTTLCNPTVSAVKGFHNRKRPAPSSSSASTAELVDETKKAREYAGQYVPALIASFCTYTLHGRITPETRAALMPGLYACADVVGIEALRAMNAGLGAGERAIWRGVYADWKKFAVGEVIIIITIELE